MFDNSIKNSANDDGGQKKEENKDNTSASAPVEPGSEAVKDKLTETPTENKPANMPDDKVGSSKNIDDIFADTENVSSPTMPGMSNADEKKPAQFEPKTDTSATGPSTAPGGENLKKIVILMGIAIFLGIFGYGGYFVYDKFFGPDNTALDLETEIIEQENIKEIEPLEPEKIAEEESAIEEPEETTSSNPKRDSDRDGLSDDEEEALGMNINSVDSDDDGLFDREELRVYKTDPTNPDTDGDGFLDGAEVKDGYNPNGPGKLYDIN